MVAAALPTPLHAQSTPAGTSIANTAVLTQTVDGRRVSTQSNTVALIVETLIDVAVAAQADAVRIDRNAAMTVVAFDVVNTGNAAERFTLAAAGDDGAPLTVHAGQAADAGQPALDHLDLQPGERRTVYAAVPSSMAIGRVVLTATAATGRGAPGTAFPGAGANGTTAVLGQSGGTAHAATALLRIGDAPTLTKSYAVTAPDGSPRAMPGSVITYRLDAVSPDAVRGAEIADAVPEGTSFVAGSITLDDRPQSDAADGDAASFDGTSVRVALGDVPAATIRTVRFQVRIK